MILKHVVLKIFSLLALMDLKVFLILFKLHFLKPKFSFAELEEKWGKKYPIVIKSWNANWTNLSKYFKYSAEVRKLNLHH